MMFYYGIVLYEVIVGFNDLYILLEIFFLMGITYYKCSFDHLSN